MSQPSPAHRAAYPRTVSVGLQTVPNSATDVTVTDTLLFQLSVANKTAGPVTLLIQDKQSPAKTLIPTLSMSANSIFMCDWPHGVLLLGGMRWVANTANALDVEIVAFYR